MNEKKLTFAFALIFAYLLFANSAFAKLYVKPAKQGIVRVEIFSPVPAVVTKDFYVGNFYDFPIDIVLQPVGDIPELIEISESSFTLQSNETKNIEYTLTISEPGVYTGGIVINVQAEDRGPTLAYQSDLAVIANKSKIVPEIYFAAIFVVIAAVVLFYLKHLRFRR